MLITTLFPTILHLVAGLAGIFCAWSPESRELRAQVPYDSEKNEQEEMDAVLKVKLKRYFSHQRLWYIPAVPTVGLVIFGIFGLFSIVIEPFGQVLQDAAYCGGALVNDAYGAECPLW